MAFRLIFMTFMKLTVFGYITLFNGLQHKCLWASMYLTALNSNDYVYKQVGIFLCYGPVYSIKNDPEPLERLIS